jgi:hypothetical protein
MEELCYSSPSKVVVSNYKLAVPNFIRIISHHLPYPQFLITPMLLITTSQISSS